MGLVYPWKQIMYYDFDKTMNRELLMKIITVCEGNKAKVREIVCDMGNCGLLSKLGFYSNKTYYFDNPVDQNRKVCIFPDVPHCVKNLENHALDYGIVIKQQSGEQVSLTKEDFDTLIVTILLPSTS